MQRGEAQHSQCRARQIRACRAEPIHRFSHERRAQMNTPPDLCGKLFESFEPESTRGALLRLRQRRRNGEVVSSVQGDGLIDDFEVVLELLELTAHAVEAAQQRRVVDGLGAGIKKAIEGGLHDCRLARAWALGGRFQPFDNLFGESHADFSLHRRSSLELDCAFAVVSDRGNPVAQSVKRQLAQHALTLCEPSSQRLQERVRSAHALSPGRRLARFREVVW